MLTQQKLERISLLGTITGIAGNISTFLINPPTNLYYVLFVTLAVTSALLLITLKFNIKFGTTKTGPHPIEPHPIGPLLVKDDPEEHPPIQLPGQTQTEMDIIFMSGDGSEDFENIWTRLVIDISDNGIDASIEHSRRIKCKKQSANECYYRYAPIEKFKSFNHSPGGIKVREVSGGADIIGILDRPLDLAEELEIKLTMKAINIFPNKENEYWILHRFNKGEDQTTLKIIFPAGVDILWSKSDFVRNNNWKGGVATKKPIRRDFENGRLVLIAQTLPNEFRIGDKFRIVWEYNLKDIKE